MPMSQFFRWPWLAALVVWAPSCSADSRPIGPPREPLRESVAVPAKKDYRAHVAALREKLPGDDFTVVVQPPFVVVGDESAARVRARAEKTVRWAVDLLKKEYFQREPEEIIDIWLFRDKASYQAHAQQLFGETPDTPFGYYSPRHRVMVMNIATGGGTLVHEIVHPFVRANFPACPAWFNEGLGSLYEQCEEHDGRIAGRTNWRLAGLQEAIAEGRLMTFRQLTATTDAEFYGAGSRVRYAQARYLCYYLQQKGLLRRFYRAFVAAHEDDPTGYATLQDVLDWEDMAAFQGQWQEFVAGLRF